MTPRPRKHIAKIRAVAYVRVSSEQQADSGLSLEHQQAKCRALATLHDYDLVEVIVDAGESAASLDRPGMARVLEMVDARQVEAVLIAKLDRATRSVRDLADLLERFARRHVALVSASESLNTETAAGRMVVRMMAVIAEWEREAIGERTREALTAKRVRGERTSRHAPYGFTLTPGGRIEPNADEREMVLLAAECRAAGYTWQGVARELDRLNYRTRSGRPWTWNNVRSALTTAARIGTIPTPDRQ
jgi:DNA invertase Pin-like site-specific DNA recombinase